MKNLQIRIGICGASRSGKTTLFNALFGDIIVPVGIGQKTVENVKSNYYEVCNTHDIECDVNTKLKIYDTSDILVNEQISDLSYCHILLHVIDFVEYCKSPKMIFYLLYKLNSISELANDKCIHQRIIHVVNKCDTHSSEHKKMQSELESQLMSDDVIYVNVNNMFLSRFSGIVEESRKETLLQSINIYSNKKVSSINNIRDFFSRNEHLVCKDNSLIDKINEVIEKNGSLMCMSNVTNYYMENSDNSLEASLRYYLELQKMCSLLDYKFSDKYVKQHVIKKSNKITKQRRDFVLIIILIVCYVSVLILTT